MTISAGGSSGIVFPDSTTLPANQVTTYLSPGLTDTANVLTANPTGKPINFNGTTGLSVNGATLTSASAFYPVNTVLPVITGTTRDTQVLTCSTGTWSNTPTSYSYQWIRGASTNIGTNTNTYTCVTADIGSTIKCTVTATNPVGNNSATATPVGPITANTYTITYLAVAGGGGGGQNQAGGGGAGGLLTTSFVATPGGGTLTATIGGGGAGSSNQNAAGGNGSNSVLSGAGISTVTTYGGGGGASFFAGGGSGGSGGGGAGGNNAPGQPAGAGTAGQGNNGGAATTTTTGSGGGGAGAVGSSPGNGGIGSQSSITGAATYYAGGGGGGSIGSGPGAGGAGGGGAGGFYGGGVSGTANTGGGGGGYTGNGGSGVIILSIPTASYSGTTTGSPVISTSGSNTIIQFNSSGTYTA